MRLKNVAFGALLIAGWTLSLSAQGDRHIENAKGTVRMIRQNEFVIVPDDDPGTRYAAPLPESFRVDGLRVRFSGTVGEIPPNARLTATPFDLEKIEILKETP